VIVRDAASDPRFKTSVLVRGPPNIRFYAGAPLQVRAGINIGSLCIIDRAPRDFSAEEQGRLAALAALTVSEILGWRAVRKLDASQKRLAQTARMAKIGGFEFNRTSGKPYLGRHDLFALRHSARHPAGERFDREPLRPGDARQVAPPYHRADQARCSLRRRIARYTT